MITTKERALLRGVASQLQPSMQIGKEGLSENSYKQIIEMLESKELVKIKILPNCDVTAKEIANTIQNVCRCEIVQVIGSKISLYKLSNKKNVKHILDYLV